MRVTIIADDSAVYVGGIARPVDLTDLSSAIHAIQWYDTIGEIEFRYDFASGSQAQNVRFTDFSPYQVFVDRWTAAAPAASPAPTAQSTGPMNVIAD